MNYHANRGFSLIELLIVTVIVAILAMVALPSYQQSVLKSRRAEAKVVLNDVAQRLERCFTQFGAYDAAGCAIADGDTVQSQGGFYTLTVAVPDASTYTLTAAPQGPQVDDDRCGTMRLTNTGVRTITGNSDLEHCW